MYVYIINLKCYFVGDVAVVVVVVNVVAFVAVFAAPLVREQVLEW